MSVVFQAKSESGTALYNVTTGAWNHTHTNADLLIFVFFTRPITTPSEITSVTYGGQAMTLAAWKVNNEPQGVFIYYLANPPTGTNSLSVTTSVTNLGFGLAISFIGANTDSPIGATATNFLNYPGGATDPSVTITTEHNNSQVIMAFRTYGAEYPTAPVEPATVIQQTSTALANFNRCACGRSIQATAGLSTITWTLAGANTNWAAVAIEVRVSAANLTTTTIRPDAAGDEQNILDGFPLARALNWDNVNEATADENTSYAHQGSEGTGAGPGVTSRDLYNLGSYTDIGDISHIAVFVRSRKGASGASVPGVLQASIKTGGTTYDSNAENARKTTYITYDFGWKKNPQTGVAWTVADIVALQAGMRIFGDWRSGFETDTYVTQVYVEVTHTLLGPENPLARVSALRHIVRPGSYRLEATVGDVSTSVQLAQKTPTEMSVAPYEPTRATRGFGHEVVEPDTPQPKQPPVYIPTIPGIWLPRDTANELMQALRADEEGGTAAKPPSMLNLVMQQSGVTPVARGIRAVFRTITPWREDKGQTFGSWLGGLFGRK